MISTQNLHHWIIIRQFQNLSLPNFLISPARNILRQFLKLSSPNFLISSTRKLVFAAKLVTQSQLTCSQLAHWMILLALAQIIKDTWPSGYKYPVNNHNIHLLATIHLLNSAKRNSFRPLLRLLISLLETSYPFSASKLPTFPSRPKEPEHQHLFSASMMVSVSF